MAAFPLGPLPEFHLGKSYRELSPEEGERRWRYVTLQHIRLPVKGLVPHSSLVHFYDAKRRRFLTIDRFGMLIYPGYTWNGCSPKRWIWPLGWCGTWDYPCTLFASLFHDALYQFHGTKHFPEVLAREAVDCIFRDIIITCGGVRIGPFYFAAVREFGRWDYKPAGNYSEMILQQ